MKPINLDNCSSLTDFLRIYNSAEYLHDDLFLKHKIGSADSQVLINYEYILDNFMETILYSYVEEHEIPKEEMYMYRYNPKKLSYDLYGTTEMWSALLRINNMISVTEFIKDTVLVFNGNFTEALEELLNIEQDKLSRNRSNL